MTEKKSILQHAKQFLNARYRRWLGNRLPEQRSISLYQRRIFIFPARQGFIYLLVVMLIFLMAINYQNNLVFVLCFWLLAVFVVCVHHTFWNMYGLKIDTLGAEPVFAGMNINYRLRVSSQRNRDHHSLQFVSEDHCDSPNMSVFLPVVSGHKTISVSKMATQRGMHRLGRIRLRTLFPLGLLHSWSWLSFGDSVLVYPKPETINDMAALALVKNEAKGNKKVEDEGDFYGFREYKQGDPLNKIDWTSIAKGLPLMVKLFEEYEQQNYYLDWDFLPGVPKEKRLSQLCFLALNWHKQGWSFGLKLPNHKVDISRGEQHLKTVLEALALF